MWSLEQLPGDLATPCLIVDEATVRRNIARMAEYCRTHSLKLRPHTKTHKSRCVAQLQLQAGAAGLTTAKVGEAEVLGDLTDDILIAYPAVDPARTTRLAALARERTVRVAIDSPVAAEALSHAASSAGVKLGVLIDLDVGFHRTGVQNSIDALCLAQLVDSLGGLRCDGVFFFPGHVSGDADERRAALAKVSDFVQAVLDAWKKSGLSAQVVSGGSTPSALLSHLVAQLTEIRPGTYVYNGVNELYAGDASLDDCAARIVATVVSDSVPGKVVIDAGTKTLTSDRCGPRPDSGHGLIVEYPDAQIVRLTEEHGEVDVARCNERPRVGQRVTVVPNHICPCVNLMDRFWWHNADGHLRELVVDARGRLS
jgi:D-serine deaminase-like pyridoxal phosphate-dependent protein